MEVRSFFFDSYAFLEIIKGNPDYNRFSEKIKIVTTRLNLMELHYIILVLFGREKADQYYDRLLKFVVDIEDEIIKEANVFRAAYKKRDLSYVDCIGYIIAKSLNIRFLTGDEQFKDLENVEFVK